MNIKQEEMYGLRPKTIDRVVYIGAYKDEYNEKLMPVFCKIEYKDEKLSITGVVAPTANGNCLGSCGQMYDSIIENLNTFSFAKGWGKVKAFQFVEYWKEWHLNDLQAGCEHQRKDWDTDAKLTMDTYELTYESITEEKRLKDQIKIDLKAGKEVKLTKEEQKIYEQGYSFTIERKGIDPEHIEGYEFKNTEDKSAHWTNYPEFENGLLGKPCKVCRYKYGSAWLKKDVPTKVLNWLNDLPAKSKVPAWI